MAMRKYKTRDELCAWGVSIYQNAAHFFSTQDEVLDEISKLWGSEDFRRLTNYDKRFVQGWLESYDRHLIYPLLEHGAWVRMPDGSEQWFGVEGRLAKSTAQLEKETGIDGIHRYVFEHEIAGRSGIYWRARGPVGEGQKPYFLQGKGQAREGEDKGRCLSN